MKNNNGKATVNMFNLNKFISDSVTMRQASLFVADIENNRDKLQQEIEGKSVCVIGGAGTIGSSFIRALLPFKPSKLIVIDLNENGLAELTRDLRSTYGMFVPNEYRTYTLNFADPILHVFSVKKRGLILLLIFLLISTFVVRRTNTVYRLLLRIMISRQRSLWTYFVSFHPSISSVSQQTRLLIR